MHVYAIVVIYIVAMIKWCSDVCVFMCMRVMCFSCSSVWCMLLLLCCYIGQLWLFSYVYICVFALCAMFEVA